MSDRLAAIDQAGTDLVSAIDHHRVVEIANHQTGRHMYLPQPVEGGRIGVQQVALGEHSLDATAHLGFHVRAITDSRPRSLTQPDQPVSVTCSKECLELLHVWIVVWPRKIADTGCHQVQ
jgi:hypothetical protein